MAKRFYFCTVLGTGTEDDPYRTFFVDRRIPMQAIDMRVYPQVEDGFFVCWGQISDTDHALAIADPSVSYLPFETAAGAVVPLTGTVSQVSAANRATVAGLLQAHGVPTAGIAGTWTIARVLQLARRRMALGLLLSNLDFDEPTEPLSAMPRIRLKALRRALTNSGFDVSGLNPTMTQAEAIAALADQPVMDARVAAIPGLTL